MKSEAEVGKPELSLVSESRDFSLAAILFPSFDTSIFGIILDILDNFLLHSIPFYYLLFGHYHSISNRNLL